jgi:large subunit ribosomal protein L3
MKSLLTKKVNMTQVFNDNGTVEAVTVLIAPEAIPEDMFKEGDEVAVTGTSKGKGFQGVVKRHKFKGGQRTHGQKHSEREPGSIGGGARAGGRVAKGLRMAGRMGGDTITVKNLKVVKILPESKEIMVSGAIPGRRGSAVIIKIK